MKKDILDMTDDELEKKWQRIEVFQNTLFQEKSKISQELTGRKLFKALNVVGKIPWKCDVDMSVLTGFPHISIYLFCNEDLAPEEYLNIFGKEYHDSVHIGEYTDIDVRLQYNDGELGVSGDKEDMLKFIRTYKINIQKVEGEVESFRNKIFQQLKALDDFLILITGITPIEM